MSERTQYQKKVARDAAWRRAYAIARSGESITVEAVRDQFPGFSIRGLARIFSCAIRDAETINGGPLPRLAVRAARQIRPMYERPAIPYEGQTDLPLLVDDWRFVSIDDAIRPDSDTLRHGLIAGNCLTPLECLLNKEERESEEWQYRQRSIDEFIRWMERRNSAFNAILETETHAKHSSPAPEDS